MAVERETGTAYQLGVAFWEEKIAAYKQNFEAQNRPDAYEWVINLENYERAKMMLNQLKRRRTLGVI